MEEDKLIIPKKRPKGEDGYKVFSVRLKEETVGRLDAISGQTGHSRNELIGLLLEYAMDHCELEE